MITIMRGIPGSGKSTWIKNNWPEAKVFSADLYFTDPATGEYKFDGSKLKEAHNWCLNNFLHTLVDNKPNDLVVDNTNIREFEIAPYYRLAEVFGRGVQIVQMDCPLEVAIVRQTHGVPIERLSIMHQTMSQLPPWWNIVKVKSY